MKQRTCAAIEARPDLYEDDCCDAPGHDHGVAPLLAQVRSAKTRAAMHELLGLDSFMAY